MIFCSDVFQSIASILYWEKRLSISSLNKPYFCSYGSVVVSNVSSNFLPCLSALTFLLVLWIGGCCLHGDRLMSTEKGRDGEDDEDRTPLLSNDRVVNEL